MKNVIVDDSEIDFSLHWLGQQVFGHFSLEVNAKDFSIGIHANHPTDLLECTFEMYILLLASCNRNRSGNILDIFLTSINFITFTRCHGPLYDLPLYTPVA